MKITTWPVVALAVVLLGACSQDRDPGEIVTDPDPTTTPDMMRTDTTTGQDDATASPTDVAEPVDLPLVVDQGPKRCCRDGIVGAGAVGHTVGTTYLSFEPASDPGTGSSRAISFDNLLVCPGDDVEVFVVGDYTQTEGGDETQTELGIVFSSSNELGPPDELARVVGAIAVSGAPQLVTENDIAEDLPIDSEPLPITIPPDATHFFLGDYPPPIGDNDDADSNLGINLRCR